MTAPSPAHRFGVYIGRFQPPHTAHLRVMEEALDKVGRLIVVIGSAHAPRTLKNPWTAGEREELIGAMLREAGVDLARVRFAAVPDHPYDEDRWLTAVRTGVAAHTGGEGGVALIGHLKDDSSYYLRSFPDWPFLPTAVISPLSATDVRRAYFAGELEGVAGMVPPAVHTWLEVFRRTPEFAELEADAAWLRSAQAEAGTWPPLRVEALAVVRDPAGRVLLTRRDERPGRGLLSLPGAGVLPSEPLAAAARRAAAGALGVTPDDPALALSPTPATVYDAPGRSTRGRVIAHVFAFEWTGPTGAEEWTLPQDALSHPEAFFEDTHALLEQSLSPAAPH
ncbi:adenylyltransferase/cytidyltransferase family protein [Deinococcus sp. SDU3-2]|uniref:Adenylyltransferase/cytidyltransferase family protein n=1 Tax=Deinococcus terrestris TaxID=2651870 RepID=A0A7X1NXJ6_9DEIO|nr:adenylyltransferase/cytidyltransferase family protein [Deinococcus terrestris]MPY67580.1 adenylyltransferase/cytidyltransferase family protein [Deinococcus terrestris]